MAASLIREAVSVGAPAYNAGEVALCTEIYAATATQLLQAHASELDARVMQQLEAALLANYRKANDERELAWSFRRAFDSQLSCANSLEQVMAQAIARPLSDGSTAALNCMGNSGTAGPAGGPTLLQDFTSGKGLDVQARVVNDTVMGGRSGSRVRADAGGLLFEGDVTKRGGGGFASVRFNTQQVAALQNALLGGTGVAFSVRALEGCKAWKFQFHQGWDSTTWQADFDASEGGVQKVPFSRFVPTWRGMPQGSAGLSVAARRNISGFGFMLSFLSDNGSNSSGFREGPFTLQILRVEIY